MKTVNEYTHNGKVFTFTFHGTQNDVMTVCVSCKEIGFWEMFEWEYIIESYGEFVNDVLNNCII